jgi:hypothetical protein
MIDIDATPGPAGKKSNEPEGQFDFYIVAYKQHAEPLIEAAKEYLAFKPVYDAQRPVLENETHVARATELAKKLGEFLGPKGKFVTLYKTDSKSLDDALAEMKKLRDAWMAPIMQFEGELRERINSFQRKQRAAQLQREEQEKAKAAALAKTGEPEKVQAAAEILSKPPERAGTVKSETGSTAGFAIRWKIRSIEDDALPREFCSPDTKKIMARVATMTEEQKRTPQFIPGVILEEVVQTRLS